MEKKLKDDIEYLAQSFVVERPLRLMFQDEARFGRITRGRRCWHKKPMRPVVKAMLTHEYTYAYAAVSPQDGRLDALVLPHVDSVCMQVFLNEVAKRYPDENIVMVLDGAGWHRSSVLTLPGNMKLHFLPPYSPELNPQEHVWDELREKYFHNKAFESMDALENELVRGLFEMENNPPLIQSICAWDWIINAIKN